MDKDIAVFARTTYRNQSKEFGIKTDDRRRHMYLIGKTGMGKSTVLENMIIGDIQAGRGVAVVDPHGDLAEKIIKYIPDNRLEDVVYFNPSDIDYPIAFNIVEQVEPHLRHLVASGLIGVFKKLWSDSWGPRLEYILRNTILAILDFPGSTLLGVVRMLSDKNYRKRVVANVKDPVVKAFWEKEFSGYADRFASEAVAPIQNKVGQFLSSSLMRNVIGQVRSSIDIRDIMDNGKILIMNLSKGRIGEDNSALLGAMMVTKIQLAAMSRVDVLEKDRRDFYLYIDEFQNFSTDSFAGILSEARKYHLNLILAHQYIEQLSDVVKPAVFGNVGTIIVFRVGAIDAEELVKEFTPTFVEEDLVNLPKYEMYLKLMIDGITSAPFSAIGLPPLRDDQETNNVQKLIDFSRQKYASKREEVEEKIMDWHSSYGPVISKPVSKKNILSVNKIKDYNPNFSNNDFKNHNTSKVLNPVKNSNSQQGNLTTSSTLGDFSKKTDLKASMENSSSNKEAAYPKEAVYKSVCSICGKETRTIFKPDGIRPIYCRECLSKKKAQKREELALRRLAKEKEKEKENINFNLDFKSDVKNQIKSDSQFNKSSSSPDFSLNNLNKANPVDFRGRKMKNNSSLINKDVELKVLDKKDNQKIIEKNKLSDLKSKLIKGKLQEGEEVIIEDNNY